MRNFKRSLKPIRDVEFRIFEWIIRLDVSFLEIYVKIWIFFILSF